MRRVGLCVVVVAGATAAILLFRSRPRQMIDRDPCAANLRELCVAVWLYDMQQNFTWPAADGNIPAALAPMVEGAPWLCPNDPSPPPGRREAWCSYAPNASVEETDEIIGAFASNARLPDRGLIDIAPTTIAFIEMWTAPEVAPGHPGFELKLDQPGRSMVVRGRELVAIRSYRVPRPVRFDADGRLTDCGNYLFLRAFIGKRLEEMYHHGLIHVAYIDGHVEARPIKDLISCERPMDNPEWTRADEGGATLPSP